MRATYGAITAITVLALAVSGQGFAGGKGGGGGGGGHQSGEGPKESINLNYGKVEHTYTPQKQDGTRTSDTKATKHRITNVRNNAVDALSSGPGPLSVKKTNTPRPSSAEHITLRKAGKGQQ